jgi:hypothetical protein
VLPQFIVVQEEPAMPNKPRTVSKCERQNSCLILPEASTDRPLLIDCLKYQKTLLCRCQSMPAVNRDYCRSSIFDSFVAKLCFLKHSYGQNQSMFWIRSAISSCREYTADAPEGTINLAIRKQAKFLRMPARILSDFTNRTRCS